MSQPVALLPLVALAGALMGAYFAQLGARWSAGFKPSFWHAFSATLLAYAAGFAAVMLLIMLGMTRGWALPVLIYGLTCALLYGRMLRHPKTGPLGWKMGARVAIVQLGLSLAAWTVIMLVALKAMAAQGG